MKTLFKSIMLSVALSLLTVACVGGGNSASGTDTAGISSIGATAANGNSSSSGNEKYSSTSPMLMANWTLDGERTPVYNLYDMGWHVLTLTATQVIGGPINIQGLIGTVEPNPLYHCGQTVQIQDINCDYATFAESGDHCSAYIRISYNYESYNYQQCNATVKFQPRNFIIGNNVDITDRMQAQNSAADYRIVHDCESAYYSGSTVAANIEQYRIISLENGSPESVVIGEMTAPNNQAFALMNRSESAGESDPYYGTWKQCTVNANHALGQVAILNHLNESCILVYQAESSATASSESTNITIYTNAQNVFPYNAGNYSLRATYNVESLQWESMMMSSSQNWDSVGYGNGKFVALSDGDPAAYSTDGINWKSTSLPAQGWSVTYGNGKFVAGNYGNSAAYSTDGINWELINMPSVEGWCWWWNINYVNSMFIAFGGGPQFGCSATAYSYDGINWYNGNGSQLPVSGSSWSITYGKGIFAAVGGSNYMANSTDGIHWIETALPIYANAIAYGESMFVAVGNNVAAYSTDGINWQSTTSLPTVQNWNSITYGTGMFVATSGGAFGGSGNNSLYSTNGINWESASLPNLSNHLGWVVTYGNREFIGVSWENNIGAISVYPLSRFTIDSE